MNATLELDELKQAWRALDRRLERQYALDLQQFRDNRLRQARGPLQLLAFGQILQALGGGAFTVLFGRFAYSHLSQVHLAFAGAFLSVYAAMCWAFAVRDLQLIHRIDYAAPVLEIQRRLAALFAWHYTNSRWLVIAGCLMWVPLTQLAFYAVGADLWRHDPMVILSFWASAMVCLLLAALLVQQSRRPGNPRLAALIDRIALGGSVIRARQALLEIQRFEAMDDDRAA